MNQILKKLLDKGVVIPNPESVYISEDVNPERISGRGVVLHSGTKLSGPRTLIMEKTVLGIEGPVTLDNTLVGPDSRINAGFFQGAVFLGKNTFGAGGHVRAGTILEEEANAAHTVGLKQTILFPFVTLGSLINFCDCLMAGGTSRKNHSEVGSSFIHFNYTPNQDKATPSMFGNVHQGVMLDQSPVFLGGQGGVVGPLRLGFGCVTAAGSIVRKSEETPDRLILGGGLKNMSVPRQPGSYTQVTKIINHNLSYIGALAGLRAWYSLVRPIFAAGDTMSGWLIQGLQENLDLCIQERIKRFTALEEKLIFSRQLLLDKGAAPDSGALTPHDLALDCIGKSEAVFQRVLKADPMTRDAEAFIKEVEKGRAEKGSAYTKVIQGLGQEVRKKGSQWLYQIERQIVDPLHI